MDTDDPGAPDLSDTAHPVSTTKRKQPSPPGSICKELPVLILIPITLATPR